jgi:2-methylisocitrate lyase-like PEP mutase family enzyme
VTSVAARREVFRQLHASGCFLIPNPWDIGTARYLRHLGFKALATTSSGCSFSLGRPDTEAAVPREAALGHIADIVAATDLPVNADFQAGYGEDPNGVAESVRLCIETGVAGLSIEDATGRRDVPLFDLAAAVERVKAARRAIDASGTGVLLTARAECYLVGHPEPLPESVRRLRAYAGAGADVLYAPGPRNREDIRALVEAVAPKPLNVLVSASIGLDLSDLAALGVRRVSVGSALARAAWTGFIQAARPMAEAGRFTGLDGCVSYAELDGLFRSDWERSPKSL